MKKEMINSSTIIYSFFDIDSITTHIYLIIRETKVYLIDTYLGPGYLDELLEDIQKNWSHKELVIINTHFHWDHIWGNCCFPNHPIIAHQTCVTHIEKDFSHELTLNSMYKKGDVVMVLPNKTFLHSLIIKEDQLELYYTPGHTDDSISIYDTKTNCLYVGDNLERPIVYVENKNLEQYLHTLQFYLSFDTNCYMAGHSTNLTKDDVRYTMSYIVNLLERKLQIFTGFKQQVHEANIAFIQSHSSDSQNNL